MSQRPMAIPPALTMKHRKAVKLHTHTKESIIAACAKHGKTANTHKCSADIDFMYDVVAQLTDHSVQQPLRA